MFILKSSYQIAAIQKNTLKKQCHKHHLTKLQTKIKTEPGRGRKGSSWDTNNYYRKDEGGGASRTRNANEQNEKSKHI